MKTKSVSTHGFKVSLWSRKYYQKKNPNKKITEFEGIVNNLKTGEPKFFHTAGELLRYLESQYKKMEKQK